MFSLKTFLDILRSYSNSIFAWLCSVFVLILPKQLKILDSSSLGTDISNLKQTLQQVIYIFKKIFISDKNKSFIEKETNPVSFDILQSALGKILFFKSFKKKFNLNFDEAKYLFYMRYSFFINEDFFLENSKIYRNNLLSLDERFYIDFHILYALIFMFFNEIRMGSVFEGKVAFSLFLSNIIMFFKFIIKRFFILFWFNVFFKFSFFMGFGLKYIIFNYRKIIIFDYIIMFLYSVFYMFYIWVVFFNNFFLRLCLILKLDSLFTNIEYMNDFFFRNLNFFASLSIFGQAYRNTSLVFNWSNLFVKNETIFTEYAGGLKRTYIRLTSENNVDSVFCFWVRRQNFFFITASPWPFLVSMFVIFFMAGFVLYFNYYTSSYYLYFGLFLVFVIFSLWCRDFIRELILNENYSALLFQNFKVGFWLFIVSEFMLFFSFFWALFHSSFEVSIYLGMQWPPMDGVNINSIKIPFMNTILLVCSGLSLTAAQFGLVAGRLTVYRVSFLYTVFHAVCFLISQLNEYMIAFQQANDSVYGSTMYMLTAFHGMHVFIGLCFLFVCFVRSEFGHMRANDILGFILAGWYWHFVDVVWIGVFLCVYVYGTLYPFILPINFEDIKLYEIRAFI